MAMDRRDFVKHLALLAAGAAALPQQIAAFENYYTVNSIEGVDLAAVDEILVSGMASSGLPVYVNFWVAGESKLPGIGLNLFGGVFLWKAAPDQKIVAPAAKIGWEVKAMNRDAPYSNDIWLKDKFVGHISFIEQSGFRRTIPMSACRGTLA